MHMEVLHEAEAARGRENRKVTGEALPAAEWLQGKSQSQRRKVSRARWVLAKGQGSLFHQHFLPTFLFSPL